MTPLGTLTNSPSIYDENAREVRLTSYGEPGVPLQVPKLAPEETFTWWVYQNQQPLIIPSLDAETRFPAVAEMLKNRGVRSVCALPLTTVHRRLGGLAVGSIEADAYSREEVSFLSLVANQVALGVDDALNFDASQQAKEALHAAMSERTRLSAVRAEIGMALARKDSLRGILHTCSEAMVRHLEAAFARIWTLNSEGHELELQASAGMYTRLDGRYSRIPLGQFKIGLIAQERKAHLTNEVQNDPRIDDKEWARNEKMISFAGYPLVVEDRIVGVMGMFSQKLLTESTLNTLSFLADGIAQGIQRKQAEDRLQLLLDVTNQVVSNLQLHDLLRAISASIRRVMHCDLVSVCFPDSEFNRLQTFVLDFPESKGLIREEYFTLVEGSLSG